MPLFKTNSIYGSFNAFELIPCQRLQDQNLRFLPHLNKPADSKPLQKRPLFSTQESKGPIFPYPPPVTAYIHRGIFKIYYS
jgi:hypothetical protein